MLMSREPTAREKISSWMTNISIATLGFFVAQVFQIKIRSEFTQLEKHYIEFSLFGLVMASLFGIADKALFLINELLLESASDKKIILPKKELNGREDVAESFTGWISKRKLRLIRMYIIPIIQASSLYAGIMYGVIFTALFIFGDSYGWIKNLDFISYSLFFIVNSALFEKYPYQTGVRNLTSIKNSISKRMRRNMGLE